jgi:tRNA(Ile)-lysidine synthase
VAWQGVEVRRYRDIVHVVQEMAPHNESQLFKWDIEEPLKIPGLGLLSAVNHRATDGLMLLSEKKLAGRKLEVRFRRGGEEIQPAGRKGHHSLKKLFQEEGIPPWERDRLPLIYLEDELLAVADLWVAEGYDALAGDLGYEVIWEQGEL